MKPYFYHSTIRKLIISFGTLFNELQIERTKENGEKFYKPVPLSYTPKEKFYTTLNKINDINDDKLRIEDSLPKIGYEMTTIISDPIRKAVTINKIINDDRTKYIEINRAPYNIGFSLYIATRKMNEGLKIIEQILPYFTPDITLEIQDYDNIDYTEIPIVLENVAYEVDATGSMNDRRIILWQLDFTMKAFLYAKIDDTSLIKKTIINNKVFNNDEILSTYGVEVIPQTANINDNYVIQTYKE